MPRIGVRGRLWKEYLVMDERLRFIGRLPDGEEESAMCREFCISGETGYKIYNRYSEHGLAALTDRTRRRRSLCLSAARAGRGHDPCLQARENTLGCAQNPRDADQAFAQRHTHPGQKHDPCRAGSPNPCYPQKMTDIAIRLPSVTMLRATC